ncbi:MAG: hypothetical protein E7279_07190 [Lachnospiraceae bacterium]|nr:hypothetical protein [Lachnospiraceae bacterium]
MLKRIKNLVEHGFSLHHDQKPTGIRKRNLSVTRKSTPVFSIKRLWIASSLLTQSKRVFLRVFRK